MKSFWHFLGAVILIWLMGAIVLRIIYVLRTGRDLPHGCGCNDSGAQREPAPVAAALQPAPAALPTIQSILG